MKTKCLPVFRSAALVSTAVPAQEFPRQMRIIVASAGGTGPDFIERLLGTGHRIVAGTPQQLTERMRLEIDKTRRIMRESGMQQQ